MCFIFLLIVIIFGLLIYILFSSSKPKSFPPGPPCIPLVGNTIQLRKVSSACGGQYIAFEKLAQEYNTNILGLKLGNELVVVVFSYSLVHEIHLRDVFEGRPDNFFLRLRTMGTRKGITCTDGKLHTEHRNFVMKELRNIGYGRTPMESHIEKETADLLNYIKTVNGAMHPGCFLTTNFMNVLWSFVAGKRFERDDERLNRLLMLLNQRSKVFDMSGGVLSQYPILRFLAPNKSGYNLIKKLNKQLYNFFMDTINEHKKTISGENVQNDLIFAYIKEMSKQQSDETNTFNESQLIMTILDLFIAGSQTTSNTIDLALMTLAIREDIQNLVYQEILTNLEHSNEFPHLNRRETFPYYNAFLMEVQRFYSITPISGPRRALFDTTLGGYKIPKNTTILMSLRSVHLDENYWGDPFNFRPERFLDQNNYKSDHFMPFGQGRRRCLGDVLARACIFSFVIKIVENFSLNTVENQIPSMKLQPGIVLTPHPYRIVFKKRPLITNI